MSIASLQSTVNQMSTDDLVEALRDPPTAAKLRNALILAGQVSAVLEQVIERVALSMSNDECHVKQLHLFDRTYLIPPKRT